MAIVVVASSWLLTVIWPVSSLASGALRGAGVLQLRSAIWREIGDALLLATTVTCLLWAILWGVARLPRGRVWLSGPVAVAGLLPGLLGSLVLGLTIFEICQRMGVQPSYSPVPLVVGMVLFLLPRALAMQAMCQLREAPAGVFLAEDLALQQGSRGSWGAVILWHIREAGRFWTLALLFWWSYLELTLPSLLRPAGMAPAPMRLYNFLHYGHIPGLAAMLLLVQAIPLVLLAIGRGGWASRFRSPGIPQTHLCTTSPSE